MPDNIDDPPDLTGTAQWWRDRIQREADKERKAQKWAAMNMPPPMLQLTLENMKHTIMGQLSGYTDQLNEVLQQAVESYCTPENLAYIINTETNRVLDQVIKEEVRNWFIYGEGRKVIRAAVEQKLKEGTTWTPLDDGGE